MKKTIESMIKVSFVVAAMAVAAPAWAGGHEDYNGCKGTSDSPCLRQGTCSIQGTTWYQYVTATRGDKFDTQGWSGLCDMVHVSLVQGRCDPLGSQENVTSYLSADSYAFIPLISGTLTCGG